MQLQIGARVRRLRKSRRMTQAELALMADCTKSFISRVERGNISPSVARLHDIAWALGRPMSYFLERGGERVGSTLSAVAREAGIQPAAAADLLERLAREMR